MMIRKTWVASLVVGITITIGFSHYAQAEIAVGKIIDVEKPGKVNLVHRNGASELATYGALLYMGDHFEFLSTGKLVALVGKKQIIYTHGSAELTIPEQDIGFFGTADDNLFTHLASFISISRRAIPVFLMVRDSGKQQKPSLLQHSSLAPVGRQFVQRGMTRVALTWQGGSGILVVRPGNGESLSFDTGRAAWFIAPLPTGNEYYEISIDNQPMQWSIEVVDLAPVPPWFLDKHPQSEAQRLVRAVWLLRDGPKEWRIFALSELADLGTAGNFIADQLWIGARSGEIEKVLIK